jgi:outer membrane protein assembly factor BamD
MVQMIRKTHGHLHVNRARVLSAALLVGVALALPACSTGSLLRDVLGKEDAETTNVVPRGGAVAPDLASADEKAVATLYNGGLVELQKGSYKGAQKKFAEVERQHPYSKWATKSILMQAFAAYQRNSYDDSINAARRFTTLHPGHKDAPYAYYLIALSEYERISDVRRDQRQTEKAVEALEEIARRYPDTAYAADAKEKSKLGYDRLAAKEMEVGRYYVGQGSYLAGINRFKKVVTDYQQTAHTPEALYRLTEAYMALGVVNEAQTAAAILGHNYPNSDWYRDAYKLVKTDGREPVASESSWITRAFKSIAG